MDFNLRYICLFVVGLFFRERVVAFLSRETLKTFYARADEPGLNNLRDNF